MTHSIMSSVGRHDSFFIHFMFILLLYYFFRGGVLSGVKRSYACHPPPPVMH